MVFSRTTWVSRHQKGKPFWILQEQEMVGWKWHQLDHMQIICTLLQTDTRQYLSTQFLQAGCRSCRPANNVKALMSHSLNGSHLTFKQKKLNERNSEVSQLDFEFLD